MADELYDTGMEIRRKVLGDEHVDRSLRNANDFDSPMQNLTTSYCWGMVWGSEGLDHKSRSIANLAMLSVLGRQHELRVHTAGARRNGCTWEEIQEVLLQVAIYGGVPAAIDAFRTARAVYDEETEASGQ
ncbi:4-carboxymuconolactone decarboxylase [Tamaricihabitans halophyticus]|uniref:4-carboxymuconolactone decarboxylase n=1 Tax=Tamaricihabitans halophyticus TaxID=1262583 RepID=A0A4R2R153_9PSEU|nr:carboxymuconolactone decarboxylase family protein [Tamaricihabitans halophyticus]TCP56400.1 4-carboxymuconolactone decarboxylase [Tamaricihabitans halophyticus]